MKRIENVLLWWGSKVVLLAIAVWVAAIVGIFAGAWRLRWPWILYFLATVIITALVIQWTNAVRQRYIREAPLPRFLQRKLRETYPHLSTRDCELVERGLRQFFMACLRGNKQFVAMPSKAVDALWHERSACTPRPTTPGATPPWASFCTTPPPRRWVKRRATTMACAAVGTGYARRSPSTPRPPAACPCCLRWMPSSPLPAASPTCPTAPTSPARATRVAAGETATAAPASRTAATAAARATLAAPKARMEVEATAEGMAAAVVAGAAIDRLCL